MRTTPLPSATRKVPTMRLPAAALLVMWCSFVRVYPGPPRCAGRPGPASADLLGQADDDAGRAAQVAEQEDALELRDLAEEFGAVGAQAGDGVMDVVHGEHDTMQAQRVGWRVLRSGVRRRGGKVRAQFQLPVAVRGTHHRDLAPDAVEPDGPVRPAAFDLRSAFQFH